LPATKYQWDRAIDNKEYVSVVSYVQREWHSPDKRHSITSYDLSNPYVELWIWITPQNQLTPLWEIFFPGYYVGFFCLFFIPLLNVFCKLYVHKDNSSWQIRTGVNSVYVFYSNTSSTISLATCINNWVILHVWTYFFKRLENHIPLTNTFMYIVYIVLVI
jgi:hypothetical protein